MAEGPEVRLLAEDISKLNGAILYSMQLISGPYVLSIDNKYKQVRDGVAELNSLIDDQSTITKVWSDGRHIMLEVSVTKTARSGRKTQGFVYIAIAGMSKIIINPSDTSREPAVQLSTSIGNASVYANGHLRLLIGPGETIDDQIGEFGYDAYESTDESTEELEKKLQTDQRPLAKLLVDPNVIVGVGTVYRSEIIYLSGLNPMTLVYTLSPDAINRLISVIKYVLYAALQPTYKKMIAERQTTDKGERVYGYLYGGRYLWSVFEPTL